MTNPMRSVLAIFGGLILLRLLDFMLIPAHPISAALVGYVLAKIAREQEVRHAAAAAAIQTGIYAWVIATTDASMLPPTWIRVMLLVTTAPAMLLGAATRARARALETPPATPAPEEHS